MLDTQVRINLSGRQSGLPSFRSDNFFDSNTWSRMSSISDEFPEFSGDSCDPDLTACNSRTSLSTYFSLAKQLGNSGWGSSSEGELLIVSKHETFVSFHCWSCTPRPALSRVIIRPPSTATTATCGGSTCCGSSFCCKCANACRWICSRNSPPIMAVNLWIVGSVTEISASFHSIFLALPADLCSALADTILSIAVGLYSLCSSPRSGR